MGSNATHLKWEQAFVIFLIRVSIQSVHAFRLIALVTLTILQETMMS